MEDDWVVDTLVGFLQSDTWKVPVSKFIEEKCIVFDQTEENETLYGEVHYQYEEMIDRLLDTFTSELGITQHQLADVCVKSKNLQSQHEVLAIRVPNYVYKSSEDFELFKTMMIQRNIELERQALVLLQKLLGQSPDVYEPKTKGSLTAKEMQAIREKEEEKMLQEALLLSKKEYELEKSVDDQEMERLLQLVKQESLKTLQTGEKKSESSEDLKGSELVPTDQQGKQTTNQNLDEKEFDFDSNPNSDKNSSRRLLQESTVSQQQDLIPLASKHSAVKKELSGEEAAQLWLQSAKAEAANRDSPPTKLRLSAMQLPDNLKAREAYLRRQRDRLLETKKKACADKLKNNRASRIASTRTNVSNKPVLSSYKRFSSDGAEIKESSIGSIGQTGVSGTELSGASERQSKMTKTGILCTVIARKLKKEETEL